MRLLKGKLERPFGVEPPGSFDEIGIDVLTEQFSAELDPDDLPAWDQAFDLRLDEPEGEAA